MNKQAFLLMLLGIAIGWFSKTWVDGDRQDQTLVGEEGMQKKPSEYSGVENFGERGAKDAGELTYDAPLPQTQPSNEVASIESDSVQARFKTLLDAAQYPEAVEHYAQVDAKQSNGSSNILKPILLNHLSALIGKKENANFIELTDHFLTFYYDDIDVLLLLVEFNQKSESYWESLGFFQLAFEYAYTSSALKKVRRALDEFFTQLDSHLISLNDWHSLGYLYDQANLFGILSDQQKLRYAQVLIHIGDTYESIQLLKALSSKSAVESQALELLASLNGDEEAEHSSTSAGYASAVPLVRHGNQYLLRLELSHQGVAQLLIDTGASLTTLTQSAFHRLAPSMNAQELGFRIFTTANGVTKGRVYQVEYVALGGYELRDIRIAVLDFDMPNGIDGLLGMNVLGKFRFQIEQESERLLIFNRQ